MLYINYGYSFEGRKLKIYSCELALTRVDTRWHALSRYSYCILTEGFTVYK